MTLSFEDAVAFTPFREGVVGSTREVRGEAVFEGRPAGVEGAAGGPPGALDHLGRPRKADPAHLFFRDGPVLHTLQIAGSVGPQYFFVRNGARDAQIRLYLLILGDAFAQQGVFDHREAVPLR